MPEDSTSDGRKRSVYIEDGLIIVSIALLFWLGVLERDQRWAQLLMGGVLVVMLTVLVRRLRRVHGAFTQSDNQLSDGEK